MAAFRAGLAAAAAIALLPAAAHADTLAAALASAYETNPELNAQRAVLRQADETVPQALSGYRPTVGVQAGINQNGIDFGDNGRVSTAGVSISQPLYTGGGTRAAVGSGENTILASRARLRAVENTVLVNVVTAYADVLALTRVVELNGNQVKVLERELQASRDRFEVGDLTRTDVAQAEARLARARSQEIAARGRLETAREAYLRVVGRPPADLEPVPPLPVLPGTPGQAVDIASANNPSLIAARFLEAAARYDVRTLEAQRLPSLAATAGAQYQKYDGGGSSGSFVQQGSFFTQTVGLSARVPLYQAGLVGSQIRQAQQRRSELLEAISVTARQVVETTTNSFTDVATARGTIASAEVGVRANTLALEGVKQENAVGSRTIIEVLNAEQELLTSQVDLVQARRDEYVASYRLLAGMGLAEAGALRLPVTAYDPTANARRVRRNWGDWTADPNPPALPLPDAAAAAASATSFAPVPR